MASPEPDEVDELLVELLARQARGEDEAIRALLESAGERADALRDALALTAELEDLGRLLGEEAGALPDELARLGRFEDLRPIADGGLARVYRARDPRLERDVALKILHPDHAGADVARTWILAEGRALAGIQHDSVVRVFEVDEAEGLAYVAMEFVDGPNLHDVLGALRDLGRADLAERHAGRAIELARALVPVAARLRLVRDLADALVSCHARGIVHRDVKPANVLIDPAGTPKLIDFGLAHRVEAGTLGLTQQLVGTPGYLAPEQVENDRTGASPRSDQFSLGTLLYELLTRTHPFQAESRAATMHAVARAAPTPPGRLDPGIPADVERVCLHALEREPADRYSSLAEMRDDLDALLELRAISLAPDTPWKRWSRSARRHRGELVAAAGLVLLGAVVVVARGGRARGEVLDALGAMRGRIAEVHHATEAQPLYTELIELKGRGVELDGASLGRLIHGPVVPAVLETTFGLAHRCGQLLEAEVSGLRASTTVEAQQGMLLSLLSRWRGPITSEEVLLGRSAPNVSRLAMGTAGVPRDCTVWRLDPRDWDFVPAYPLLEGTDLDSLPVGDYRAVRSVDGRIQEVEFEVTAWSPTRRYDPRAYRPNVPLLKVSIPEPLAFRDELVVDVAPYEITAEPIRWRDLNAVLTAEELQGLTSGVDRPDEFVRGNWNFAAELARLLGARLPTPLELHLARWHAGELEGRIWTSAKDSSPDQGALRVYYDASQPASDPESTVPVLEPWTRAILADGILPDRSPRVYLVRSARLDPTRFR